MDDLPNIKDMLTRACQELKVPISAKIRIFPELQDTLNYVRMIEECGVYMITVHGRLRQQRHHQGQPDYDAIKAIVDIASVPVVANGNICSKQHADEVMAYTGAHAVMSATALLYRPTLYADADYYEISNARFHEKREVLTSVESLLRTQHAWQYLDYAERTRPPYFRYIRDHVVTLVKPMLFDQGMLDLFDMLHRNLNVCSIEQYRWLLLHLFHRLDCSLCQERVRAESQLREAGVARRKACAKARAAAAKPELDDTESNDTAEQLMRLVEELQLEHDNIAVCITAQLLPSLKHIRNMKGELNCGFELPVELSEIL
jgi:tRNA-dihydrouridine synthase